MFMTVKQAASKWGISDRRIRVLCCQGKIPGAYQEGRGWKIPIDADKPADGRYKSKESILLQIDRKKKELDSKRPLTGGEVARLNEEFVVEYTYNSNAIEGNTLTITETKVILEDGLTIGGGKSLREHLEVLNHKEAIDYIQDVVSKEFDLSERVIRDLHHIILKSIDNPNAGVYRKANVLISGSMERIPLLIRMILLNLLYMQQTEVLILIYI